MNRTITAPLDQQKYLEVVKDFYLFRNELDAVIKTSPELFPADIQMGYRMKDIRYSIKLG